VERVAAARPDDVRPLVAGRSGLSRWYMCASITSSVESVPFHAPIVAYPFAAADTQLAGNRLTYRTPFPSPKETPDIRLAYSNTGEEQECDNFHFAAKRSFSLTVRPDPCPPLLPTLHPLSYPGFSRCWQSLPVGRACERASPGYLRGYPFETRRVFGQTGRDLGA
jgi:hypothetical protein